MGKGVEKIFVQIFPHIQYFHYDNCLFSGLTTNSMAVSSPRWSQPMCTVPMTTSTWKTAMFSPVSSTRSTPPKVSYYVNSLHYYKIYTAKCQLLRQLITLLQNVRRKKVSYYIHYIITRYTLPKVSYYVNSLHYYKIHTAKNQLLC